MTMIHDAAAERQARHATLMLKYWRDFVSESSANEFLANANNILNVMEIVLKEAIDAKRDEMDRAQQWVDQNGIYLVD